MYSAKYIRTRDNHIIIFDYGIEHSRFESMDIISAGFVDIYDNKVKCFGESVSLGLKSRGEEDAMLVRRWILNLED